MVPLVGCLVSILPALVLGADEPSPCAGQYADWVGDPSTFIRKDQPRNLQGLHVVCLWQQEPEVLQLEAFLNGVASSPLRTNLPTTASSSWKDFRQALKSTLGFKKRSNNWQHLELKQPFGIFATTGVRLSSAKEAVEAGLVLVIEGGQWFWPPIRKGYVRKVSGEEDGPELETLSVQPVIFRVRGFLHLEECEKIVELAKGSMVESPVSLMDKDKGKAAKEFRTSTQTRLTERDSPMLGAINKRIVKLTHIPQEHNEEAQILRYQKSQYYSAHLDNWDPQYYSGEGSAFVDYGHTNRLITVFWYLTNVTAGGETLFPRTDGLQQPRDNWSCERGLKVKPETGTVIFWYSLHPNGNTDPNGLHAACPVESGEKWSANYWVWNKVRGRRGRPAPDVGVDDPEPEETLQQGKIEREL